MDDGACSFHLPPTYPSYAPDGQRLCVLVFSTDLEKLHSFNYK